MRVKEVSRLQCFHSIDVIGFIQWQNLKYIQTFVLIINDWYVSKFLCVLMTLSSPFRLREGCGPTRLLGPRPEHHPVPSVLQNLHRSHVQAPLPGLWAGRVRPLLHPCQTCPISRVGPPGQGLRQLPRPLRQSVTVIDGKCGFSADDHLSCGFQCGRTGLILLKGSGLLYSLLTSRAHLTFLLQNHL